MFGKLNVLVNNSAMQEICEDLRDINLEVVEKTYRTNILSMFAVTKYALQHMKRGDSIVNSSSVAACEWRPKVDEMSKLTASRYGQPSVGRLQLDEGRNYYRHPQSGTAAISEGH